MKQMKNKGISLIVLIITIVVIIILAAAIILNLKDTNIINNANEAVVKQDFVTMQDELNMYVADKYVDTKGKFELSKLSANDDKVVYTGEGTVEETNINEILTMLKNSKYEGKIKIVNGIITVSEDIDEQTKEWANEVLTQGNTTINGGEFAYNNPVIPVGFRALETTKATWEDENSDGYPDGWNNGLVIVDDIGNEFVWVPCTLDGSYTIKYSKNLTYTSSYGSTKENTLDDSSALPTVNGNKINETTQIAKYGGFYIGRYEAGVPANQDTIDGTAGNGQDSKSNVDGIPVVKKDATVWTCISYDKAMPNAKKMYENNTSVKSGIVTGTAWDTVCEWIHSEKDSNDKILNDVTNSVSWGNYYNTVGDAQYDEDGITKISENKQTAGRSEKWKAKNIYDIAGNAWEWIGESYTSRRVNRGGCYLNDGSACHASYRNTNDSTTVLDNLAFRIMLYII